MFESFGSSRRTDEGLEEASHRLEMIAILRHDQLLVPTHPVDIYNSCGCDTKRTYNVPAKGKIGRPEYIDDRLSRRSIEVFRS